MKKPPKGGFFFAGLRPAPAQCNGNAKSQSGHPVGWRGGMGEQDTP